MRVSPLNASTARAVAWSACALFVMVAALTWVLSVPVGFTADQVVGTSAIGYAVAGALVASREPRNAVGWLLLTIALAFGSQGLIGAYVGVPGRPGITAAAWVGAWIWHVWLVAAALFLPLVFPDGRLLSRRWRPCLWVAGTSLVLGIVAQGLRPGVLDSDSSVRIPNPLSLGAGFTPFIDGAYVASDVLAAVGIVLGGVSLVKRLRRSRGRQRQQVASFVYTGALALAGLVLALVDVFAEEAQGGRKAPEWADVIGSIGWVGALALIVIGIPFTVGTAILRHRLYDIDLVVKRTLVYGSLTVLLAATYLASVLLFRVLLDPVTGQSDLAVAASTLAVAALFRPLRARIQAVVDRSFFRSRYDAAHTVEAFAGRLRQQVELDAVRADLQTVVRSTVHPTQVSVWLRDGVVS